MENEKYPYQKEWEEFLKLDSTSKKIRLLAPLPFLVFAFLAWTLEEWVFDTYLPIILVGIFLVILFFSIYYYSKAMDWKCPRCSKNKSNNHFSFLTAMEKGKCESCGLEKWEGSNIKDDGGFWSNGL